MMFRALFMALMLLVPQTANAFCGFYVAKADAALFNKASKVILARSDDRTVITMANDFQGDVKEFAIVIPVPTIVKQGQVNVTENRIIDHLDAYTAPRLVEYFDDDPCQVMKMGMEMMRSAAPMGAVADMAAAQSARALGVTIEESYSVGEYDILVLSAEQSGGLLTWLNQEGYKLPAGADKILGSYIRQNMKFFVAKVNLQQFEKSGFSYLRPLQVAYEHEKFMLPIRLGTLNADGPQDLIVMTLTRNGRVETSNYRTVKIPTGQNVPLFVADEFGEFYKSMFATAVDRENMKTVFMEYAWDMAWCDPCAADPLSNEDLRTLGVWWQDDNSYPGQPMPMPVPTPRQIQPGSAPIMMPPQPAPANVFVTRLHVRYDAEKFPEDLMLTETNDRENFQGRYVLQHPFKGQASCEAASQYYASLPARFDEEAKTLAGLTGWDINEIRRKMTEGGQSFTPPKPGERRDWWDDMWNR